MNLYHDADMHNEIRSSRAQFRNLSDQSVAQEQNTCPLFVTEGKGCGSIRPIAADRNEETIGWASVLIPNLVL